MNSDTLLIADADRDLRQRHSAALTTDGFVVVGASAEDRLRTLVADAAPRLIVLGKPAGTTSNAALIEQLRRGDLTGQPEATPVVVLAEHDDELTTIRCLHAGADDVLARTVGAAELSARIVAVLRRTYGVATPGLEPLRLDRTSGEATYAGRPLELSPLEFKLLVTLAANPRRVYASAELLRDVWGYKLPGKTRTVDAHAVRLRRKLASAGARGLVVNVRGVGYRLIDAPEPDAAA